jgi:hypothetical protein
LDRVVGINWIESLIIDWMIANMKPNEIFKCIQSGSLSVEDLQHLQHLGVTEIAVVNSTSGPSAQESAIAAGLVTQEHADQFKGEQPTTPAPSPLPVAHIMPDVKVIGTDDPLHPILDPTHITHH